LLRGDAALLLAWRDPTLHVVPSDAFLVKGIRFERFCQAVPHH
jgi:hypothetical protein